MPSLLESLEAIRSTLRDGRSAYLSLYDLEKAFDSIEHAILLRSLFQACVNGRSWRLIRAWYDNLTAVVRSGPTMSSPIHILRGVQQGSVLSPIFFLVIMDDLLHQLSQSGCGASICRLYLGGAAHADDVRAIASSTSGAEAQGAIISDFSSKHGLHLNSKQKLSKSPTTLRPLRNKSRSRARLSQPYTRPSAWAFCGPAPYLQKPALNTT